MMASRFRRVAVPLLVGAVALGLTGCSNKSTDAASMTYTDSKGAHSIHVSDAEYKKQLGQLVGSKQFQTLLKSHNFSLGGDQKNTTAQDVSTSYLSQLVEQSALDAQFSALKLTITPQARTSATTDAKQEFALDTELQTNPSTGQQTFTGPGAVFASFPKSFQNILIDRQARAEAVGAYYTALTPAKEHALYDEFATDLCPSGRVVYQILVKEQANAQTILDQLSAGGSFAALAKTKSTDTTSAKVGGAVGCLRKGTFVAPFEAAAYAAPFDKPIGPVKSQFGYHVILVKHASYANLRSELSTALQQNPLVARDLRLQSMKVWIDPQFGTGSLAVDSQRGQLFYSVTAPKVPAVRTCREDNAVCAAPTTTTTTVPAAG